MSTVEDLLGAMEGHAAAVAECAAAKRSADPYRWSYYGRDLEYAVSRSRELVAEALSALIKSEVEKVLEARK